MDRSFEDYKKIIDEHLLDFIKLGIVDKGGQRI